MCNEITNTSHSLLSIAALHWGENDKYALGILLREEALNLTTGTLGILRMRVRRRRHSSCRRVLISPLLLILIPHISARGSLGFWRRVSFAERNQLCFSVPRTPRVLRRGTLGHLITGRASCFDISLDTWVVCGEDDWEFLSVYSSFLYT